MYSILQRFCTFTPPAKVIGYMLQGRWASSWRAVARLAGNHREVLQGGGKVPMIAILLYPNPHVRHKLLGQRNKLVTSSRFHVVAPACPPQTYACSFVAPERRRDWFECCAPRRPSLWEWTCPVAPLSSTGPPRMNFKSLMAPNNVTSSWRSQAVGRCFDVLALALVWGQVLYRLYIIWRNTQNSVLQMYGINVTLFSSKDASSVLA